jgi:hypothetical protein
MHLLDPQSITYPTFTNTWLFALVKAQAKKVFGKNQAGREGVSEVQGYDVGDSDDDTSVNGSESGQSSAQENGKTARGPQATVKAGGRRRKQPAKRK